MVQPSSVDRADFSMYATLLDRLFEPLSIRIGLDNHRGSWDNLRQLQG